MSAKYSLIFTLFLLLTACHSTGQKTEDSSGAAKGSTTMNNTENDIYSFRTFMVGQYWGYDIYKDNQLLIHQSNIPAMEGSRGFSSEQKAISVAHLTIQKLRKGIMPPTIRVEELDSLRAME